MSSGVPLFSTLHERKDELLDSLGAGQIGRDLLASEDAEAAKVVLGLSALAFSGSAADLVETGDLKIFTVVERTKLSAIADGATLNAADDDLRDRNTHTGTQPISSVYGLTLALAQLASITYVDQRFADLVGVRPLLSTRFMSLLRLLEMTQILQPLQQPRLATACVSTPHRR